MPRSLQQAQQQAPVARAQAQADAKECDRDAAGSAGEAWTIGHSTHTFPAFLELLQAHGVQTVADVRRFPGSRRHPQFGGEALGASLAMNGIAYHWFSGLGGRRRPDDLDPEGSAWRHSSFRAYAQHLRSEEFAQGLDALLHVASASRTAIMCSELLWWRCHRRLIADVMVFCGWRVTHILGTAQCSAHRIALPAHVDAAGLSYSAQLAGDPRDTGNTGDTAGKAGCC
jgi:uncharacterized protein (DUF488 family)